MGISSNLQAAVLRIPIALIASLVSLIGATSLTGLLLIPFAQMISLDPLLVFFPLYFLAVPVAAGLIAFALSIFAASMSFPRTNLTAERLAALSAVTSIAAALTSVALASFTAFTSRGQFLAERCLRPFMP